LRPSPMNHLDIYIVLAVVAALFCCLGASQAEDDMADVVVLKHAQFAPVKLSPHGMQGFNVLASSDLERTPRDYLKVTAQVQATGRCRAQLALLDFLNREHRGETVDIPADQLANISIDITKLDRPLAMLRAVRIYAEGEQLDVLSLEFHCTGEQLPKPDVIAAGTDDKAIQAALDALGADGGVVYIPAGEYIINNQVTITGDNIIIYGDGRDTIIQGTWCKPKGLFKASKCSNLRITRLNFRSLPMTHFRGYNDKRWVKRPEDIGRPSVLSHGIELDGCTKTRVDHCELTLFGFCALVMWEGREICIDHCFFHENFRSGYGYGAVPYGTKECYIEDNSFENHRHGVAGGGNSMASYTCRFNRFVQDTSAVPETGWEQMVAQQIDVHPGCSWMYVHDNWVKIDNAMLWYGTYFGGNPGWIYRNTFVNCTNGIYIAGACDDVWTWDNQFTNCSHEQVSKATGTVHFDAKPANFAEIPYPHELNRLGWWPGSGDQALELTNPQTQFAGPTERVLQCVTR